ncbi:hypothetical protein Tco_0793870 [Tanacetum coccineum]
MEISIADQIALDDALNIRVNSFTMKMEILLEPTSNKLMVEHAEYDESNTYVLERFNTSAGNPVKKILLKLNLSDHRLFKMVVEVPDSSCLTRSITTCSYPTDKHKVIMKAQSEIVVRRADQKEYTFKEADFSRFHLNDIEDMFLLYVHHKLHNLTGDEIVDLVNALCTFTRGIIIQRRVENVQLRVESYQKKLNITKPQTPCDGISFKEPDTIVYEPIEVVYLNKSNRKRLMRADELYSFSDEMLECVRDNLHEMLHNFMLGYNHGMPKRASTEKDQKQTNEIVKMIDNLDDVFLALGWHLEEIHVTWAHLEKKRTRLRLYTKYLEEPRI